MDDIEAQRFSFQELTGQGTAEQRSFTNVGVGVEWEPLVSAKKSFRLSAFEEFNTLTEEEVIWKRSIC